VWLRVDEWRRRSASGIGGGGFGGLAGGKRVSQVGEGAGLGS
jgi:hypothetical protein